MKSAPTNGVQSSQEEKYQINTFVFLMQHKISCFNRINKEVITSIKIPFLMKRRAKGTKSLWYNGQWAKHFEF